MAGNMVGFQPLENKMKIKATALFPRLSSYFIAGDCVFQPPPSYPCLEACLKGSWKP
jgi:hypothetical protein